MMLALVHTPNAESYSSAAGATRVLDSLVKMPPVTSTVPSSRSAALCPEHPKGNEPVGCQESTAGSYTSALATRAVPSHPHAARTLPLPSDTMTWAPRGTLIGWVGTNDAVAGS
jgi:hypothetical protein